MAIEIDDFQESFERRVQQLQDELAETPKECNALRNSILRAIKELHKLRGDMVLGRDTEGSKITFAEIVEGEERMEELIKRTHNE